MNLYTFCEYLVNFGEIYTKEEGLDVKECVSGIITLFLCYYDQLLNLYYRVMIMIKMIKLK
jgi:hypothetical protein